ncbi:hypothetical protein [Leifsonia aquatica]|uniref:hypothetical protein n=1 Tax=Leifsonia aquatica TaxID=144185 RepID=UPI0038134E04
MIDTAETPEETDSLGSAWSAFYARRLRPHPFQYVGGSILPLTNVIGAAVLIATSVYLAVRWFGFAGARRLGDTLIVSGILWSRRIPLRRIDRVTTGYVFVVWRTRRGGWRWTPITSLWSKPRPLDVVTRYSNRNVRVIRGWVKDAVAAAPHQDRSTGQGDVG